MSAMMRHIDQWGREIILMDAQWTGHILPTHAELAGQIGAIEATLTTPTVVMNDARHANGENFYLLGALPPPFDQTYLKVCVRFTWLGPSGPWRGEVLTAYAAAAVKRGGVQKWP